MIVNSGGYWFAYIFAYDLIRKDKRKILSFVAVIVQLLLRLGTFQLSDIFYNTVGGVLGGLLYCVAMKARKRLPVPKVGMADSE